MAAAVAAVDAPLRDPTPGPNVGELLRAAVDRLRVAGTERPRLDAELLLGHVTGADRTAIVAHPEAPVSIEAVARFESELARRERGEPVAYIRETKEFYGLTFRVDRRALIPRPETERLVELAEREVVARLAVPRPAVAGSARPAAVRVAEVGTGSGAVAIAVATLLLRRGQLADVEILATDNSSDALELAAENVADHALAGRIRLAAADLLPEDLAQLDLLIANLPYIPSAEIDGLPVAASFEPRAALDGGPDGLDVIRRLLARLPAALAPSGKALLEIGADQEEPIGVAVRALLPDWRCRVELDLARLPRVAVVERAR